MSQTHAGGSAIVECGLLRIDLANHTVRVRGRDVRLTQMERRVLERLAMSVDVVVSRDELLTYLYSGAEQPMPKILQVFVCYLRKKLAEAADGEHYIKTSWGEGYALTPPSRNTPA